MQARPGGPHAAAASIVGTVFGNPFHRESGGAGSYIIPVLSPSTEAIDRADKVPTCARERVPHVWLLDPRIQTIEVFSLDSAHDQLIGTWRGNATARVPPFEALEFDLGALWA